MWAFKSLAKRLTYFIYEQGSRSRKVLTKMLEHFKGFFTSDGYTAYKAYNLLKKESEEGNENPDVIRGACWVHSRRVFVDALESYVKTLSKMPDCSILLKKALHYFFTEWEALQTFLKDSSVEISNNLIEQAFRQVKLNLKNCQNIGSEKSAVKVAFMFSITESCTMNGIPIKEYLKNLFFRRK